MSSPNNEFSFEISLSVLNHLGRQLYRSFATVLGEAISIAWDAEAQNVYIFLDADRTGFWIKDDGIGMSADDFQNKFLRIGYSKRKDGSLSTANGRPFIGRKGIGKLALLSCADKITVISKVKNGAYVGGTIDNSQLDVAITEDLTPQQYKLGDVDVSNFSAYTTGHDHGTIIRFHRLKDGVNRTPEFLRKTIALYFRFSLIDKNFNVYLNNSQVTHDDLRGLAEKTEFLWKVGVSEDPFVTSLEAMFSNDAESHESKSIQLKNATGFFASVLQPRDLKVLTTDERVGVDLFVNGRLRERDILKHIPTARLVESYLYGQIHFSALEGDTDRFTSSREGIVADDPVYRDFLEALRKEVLKVVEDWDDWRLKHRKDGDDENEKVSKAQRASKGLYNAVTSEFVPQRGTASARKVDSWVNDLGADAAFNFESYAECFISENLIRKYIVDRKITLSPEALEEAAKYRGMETDSKNKANISIELRHDSSDLSYLSMKGLANLVDKPQDPSKNAALGRDANEFKPMRDAVAHTALLTEIAKDRLRLVRENIKARIKKLLSTSK